MNIKMILHVRWFIWKTVLSRFVLLPIVGHRDGRSSMEPRIRWWSPYSRPFRSTEKVPKKKGALKGIWVAMKDFPSTPIKMASLIGNMVNWRYCRIKWELTNQLGLNLESKWWMCTTMTLPVASHLWKKADFSPSTRKILRVSVASPGRSNPS